MNSNAKIGVSLFSYHADIWRHKLNFKEAVQHAASIGLTGVELVDHLHFIDWPKTSIASFHDWRDYVESLGMEIACFSFYPAGTDTWVINEDLEVEKIKNSLAIASELGAKVVRCLLVDEIDKSSKLLARCIPYAKKYGVKIGLEIHAPFPPEAYLQLVRQLDSEYVGLIPDFSAWQRVPEQEDDLLVHSLYGNADVSLFKDCLPYTLHIHAKSCGLDEQGNDPHIPYRELLGAVADSDFGGFVVSELEDHNCVATSEIERHVSLIKSCLNIASVRS